MIRTVSEKQVHVRQKSYSQLFMTMTMTEEIKESENQLFDDRQTCCCQETFEEK